LEHLQVHRTKRRPWRNLRPAPRPHRAGTWGPSWPRRPGSTSSGCAGGSLHPRGRRVKTFW